LIRGRNDGKGTRIIFYGSVIYGKEVLMSKMIHCFALMMILALGFSTASGQGYPNKPVTIVNPLPGGGGVDIALRGLAKEMQTILGQPVLVESRTGAGGLIAGEYVAKAKPDGYTIGCLQSTQAIPEVFAALRKPPYTSEDYRFVVRYMCLPYALVSRAGAPWKSLKEFVKYVQDNPNKVKYGHTIGVGHPLQLLSYSLFKKNQLKVIEVPFKGAADAIVALLGGHIDVGFGISVTSIQGHVQAGKLTILALHSAKSVPSLPDIPTFKEMGFDPGVVPIYNVFVVPKGTPEEAVKKIHDTVKAAMETPALKDFAEKNVFELYYGSEKDILEELKRDREVSEPLVDEVSKLPK
jgi:tripartite-type tricarboxylate transporter receptor subunit TctC